MTQAFGDNAPNSRYLILNVWTGDNTATAWEKFKAEVNAGKKVGCNAVKVHASWQLCESNPGSYDFSQIDARLDYVIKEMRLPAALYIDLTRAVDSNNSSFISSADIQCDINGNFCTGGLGRQIISFSSAAAISQAVAFTQQLTRHCHTRYADKVLFYEPVFSPYAETEYFPSSLYDYSTNTLEIYRKWLSNRYETIANLNNKWQSEYSSFIAISPLNNFNGVVGATWYLFRHEMLKNAINNVADAIHLAAPGSMVSIRFGSIFDSLMYRRGTVFFSDLCTKADIVFVDDAPTYNHKWSMDLLRSSLPGKYVGNEMDGPSCANDVTYSSQISQSFEHGAKYVTIANWDAGALQQREKLFAEAANLLKEPVTAVPADAPVMQIDMPDVWRNGYGRWQNQYEEMTLNGKLAVRINLKNNDVAGINAENN